MEDAHPSQIKSRVTSNEQQSCRPSSSQPRLPATKKLPSLSSPHSRRQNPSKSHHQRNPPSPKNHPKDHRWSSTAVASGHLLGLRPIDHLHHRTSRHLRSVILITCNHRWKKEIKLSQSPPLQELFDLAATARGHFRPRYHHGKSQKFMIY